MRVQGTVIGSGDGRALIRLREGASCTTGCCACAASALCGAPQVEAVAREPVEKGTEVIVDMPSRGTALSAVLVFVLPLVGLVGGVLLGEGLDPEGSNATGLAIGVGLFFALFLLATVVDRKVVRPRQPEPTIVRVLGKGATASP